MKVNVPATSGNLGPGFDVLGLALSLYNELSVTVMGPSGRRPSGRRPARRPPVIHIQGEGERTLHRDSRNIIFKAIKKVFKEAGRSVPQLELTCLNRIPLGRGLGSSAAAYASGLLAANQLLGNKFKRDRILLWASQFEGHPDDVVPAIEGGVRASFVLDHSIMNIKWPNPSLRMVVAIPDFELPTRKARKVLPKWVPLKDAVFNIAAVAVMREAFRRRHDWLRHILNDRLHEPYRSKLVPGFYRVKKAALASGAEGVILSGAGPTMLSFVKPSNAARVARAMERAFKQVGVKSRTMNLGIAKQGAIVK